MNIVSAVRATRMKQLARDEGAFYADARWALAGSRERWQLEQLNSRWAEWTRYVPWFRDGVSAGRLPPRIESLEQFQREIPVMDKRLVRTAGSALHDERGRIDEWRATGGTTGEPVRFPVGRLESRIAAASLWHARGWFGVVPDDRLFMIWGHSHLLGSGVAGKFRGRMRELKDRLLGYRRWSAYRIGDDDLRRAAAEMLAFRPAYVLGYSVALTRFAQVNAGIARELNALGLKVVIGTGESFARLSDRDIVGATFGARVALEYGAVETGPIAHETPDGMLQVFWRQQYVEAVPSATVPGARELLVTSLFARALPLCRYSLGDLVPEDSASAGGQIRLRHVIGRSNDFVRLDGGRIVHSEAFTHSLRDSASITAFQVRQDAAGKIAVLFESASPLAEEDECEVRRRLGIVDSSLTDVVLRRVERLPRTGAGKTRVIVSECK